MSNLNNNNINNNFNLDNKYKIRKFVSYKKEFLKKKRESHDSNLSQRINTISKKSSLKLRDIKRYSYYFKPTQKFLKPFRTSSLNAKNIKR